MIERLGIMIGRYCNANCAKCAGQPHRYITAMDPQDYLDRLRDIVVSNRDTLKHISISSSGEPTMYQHLVEKVLTTIRGAVGERPLPEIVLYTNGIFIGNGFLNDWLYYMAHLGLTGVKVTVHHFDPRKNADGFGLLNVPPVREIVRHCKQAHLPVYACVPLRQEMIGTTSDLQRLKAFLLECGFVKASCWPLRDPLTDQIDFSSAPTREILDDMKSCEDSFLRVIWPQDGTDDPSKMTLFPNGDLKPRWVVENQLLADFLKIVELDLGTAAANLCRERTVSIKDPNRSVLAAIRQQVENELSRENRSRIQQILHLRCND